jgi:hypothetical protein
VEGTRKFVYDVARNTVEASPKIKVAGVEEDVKDMAQVGE